MTEELAVECRKDVACDDSQNHELELTATPHAQL